MSALARRSRLAVPFAATLAASLVITASAHAGVASVSGATMSFSAGPGEVNDVRAEPQLDGVLFTDASAALVAGAGCVARPDGVFCPYPATPDGPAVVLDLLDGDDRGFVDDLTGIVAAMTVLGGSGDDFAHVGGSIPRAASADGGAGDDSLESFMNLAGAVTLTGGAGNDELRGREIARDTRFSGGDGADRIVIAPSPAFVGPVFEGGAGNDTIADNSGGSVGRIAAGRGLDTLTFAGVTFPFGASFDLELCPTCDVEKVVGSDFDDVLLGDGRSTLFVGGAGGDTIEPRGGVDAVSAGRGPDRVRVAGDRRTDLVQCGGDADEVVADRRDIVARDCEAVAR